MHEQSDGNKVNVKQRLIGAIVLLALAAIIIPTLLDFRDGRGFIMDGSNIPERPDGYRVEELHFDFKKDIPIPRAEIDLPVEADETVDQSKIKKSASSGREQKAEKENSGELTGKRIHELQQRVEKKQPLEKVAGEPVTGTWVVQLASLGKKENALNLRDRVRNKGYHAFIIIRRLDGTVMYRVLVGPELLRSNAESIRKALAKTINVEGIVVAHTQ